MNKQNPTCIFNIAPSSRPYVGIEKVVLKSIGAKQIPHVTIKYWLAEVNCHVVLRHIIDGKEHSSGSTNIILGPNKRRGFSIREADLPIPDIQSGKSVLTVTADISYPLEARSSPVLHQEAWWYDHNTNSFFLSPLK